MSRFEKLSNSPNDVKIQALRDTLAEMVTNWHTDRSSPPNFYRTTGLGKEVCKVDTHMDGYQWPFGETVVAIGWKVSHPEANDHDGGMVLMREHLPKLKKGLKHTKEHFAEAVEAAVFEAKKQADKALARMNARHIRETG